MNTENSVADFFYNIVPGGLFLFFLQYFSIFDLSKFLSIEKNEADSAIAIFFIILFGLLLGFVFQGITKFFRKHLGWNMKFFMKVRNNNEDMFKKAFELVWENKRYDKKISDKDIQETFYTMDNEVRGERASFMPTHFSSRFAFWSNIFLGGVIILLLRFIQVRYFDVISGAILGFIVFSFWLAEEHLYAFYDAILKTYYMKQRK